MAPPDSLPPQLAWRHHHKALQDHRAREAVDAELRFGVLHQHLGEQSTFWFYQHVKQRADEQQLSEVQTANGCISLDAPDGIAAAEPHIRNLFSAETLQGLFATRPTCIQAQQQMLQAGNSALDAEASEAAEGPAEGVTQAELLAALQRCARDKAPGCDGLPFELYLKL